VTSDRPEGGRKEGDRAEALADPRKRRLLTPGLTALARNALDEGTFHFALPPICRDHSGSGVAYMISFTGNRQTGQGTFRDNIYIYTHTQIYIFIR